MSKVWNRVLIVIFALIFLVSAGMLFRYWSASRQAQTLYRNVAQQVHQQEQTEGNSAGKQQMLPQYQTLYQQNSDLIGWIRIDGTQLDYPVVQTKDNEFYLHHSFDKTENNHGCIFADPSCDVLKPSDNIILYGHHMKDGSMFALLEQYKKESFWKEHPVIRFDTLQSTGMYEVLTVFTESVNTGSSTEFHYYDFVQAQNEKEFQDYVHQCIERSLYTTGVWAEPGDQLLTLSTCEYSRTNGRMIVVARKIASEN